MRDCAACLAGRARDLRATECIECHAGTFSPGFTQDCDICSNGVPNAARSACESCIAGSEPSGDRSNCTSCSAGWYSIIGICQECALNLGFVVSADKSACQPPFGCNAGTACPADAQCTELGQCVDCLPGSVSLGKEPCAACVLISDNQISNPAQTACTACPAGKAPTGNRSSCADCVGNDYSTIGICQPCPASEAPNADRTACVACPEGVAQTSIDGTCTCSEGYYNTSYSARCLAADFALTESAMLSCQSCAELAECVDQCRAGTVEILPGWTLLARTDASVSIFQCKHEEACERRSNVSLASADATSVPSNQRPVWSVRQRPPAQV